MQPILKQEDQWPERVAGHKTAYGEPGSFYDGEEYKTHPKKHPVPSVPVSKVKGLYGEDEDHPYDVWATPSGHGNGYDVISEVKGHPKP